MVKRGLEIHRETNRQLEQLCRQLPSARKAHVEEPTHAQSPGCDEGISEVHVGPDDPGHDRSRRDDGRRNFRLVD